MIKTFNCKVTQALFEGKSRKGQWSIRINAQWRLCFRIENGTVYDVEIVDYH